MVSYRITAYNDFETPSGAVGEAPDGPGAFAHVMDQVDGRLGVGGAEWCANYPAVLAIPSSRLFPGKHAYQADQDIEHRYDGSAWHSWNSNTWQTWTPACANLTVGNGTWTATWRHIAGMVYCSASFLLGSTSAVGSDPQITLPVTGGDTLGLWTGQIIQGGTYKDLYPHHGGSASVVELRARTVSGTSIVLTPVSASVPAAWSAGDSFEIHGLYRRN